jgi:DNA-binding transcriptional ArsR family regulator
MDGSEFDVVIFDTAPTGHTIRLLELPVDWSQFISDSAKGAGQTCMGPVQAIQESKDKYDRAITLLRDPSATRFIFVQQPEETAIFETERSAAELKRIGIRSQELIVEAILPAEVCDQPLFRKRYEMQQQHLEDIGARLPLPTRQALLRGRDLCVCEIQQGLGATQPTVSRHLGHLRHAGLVTTRKEGLWVHYELAPDVPETLRSVIESLEQSVSASPQGLKDRARLAVGPRCCGPDQSRS